MNAPDLIPALVRRIEQLEKQVGVLEDVHAIRRLQHAYGYYLDKCLYDEVVELFSDAGEVRFMGGVFRGKAGLRRLYCDRFRKNFTAGSNGPVYGFLLDHPQLQDIVHVAPDRKTARGRFRYLMQAGSHETRPGGPGMLPQQWWEGGLYENEYVSEGGVWKIKVCGNVCVYQGTFDDGWAHAPKRFVPLFSKTFPEDPNGPDALITEPKPVMWPDTSVLPFHYAHPVTGQTWQPPADSTRGSGS
jgi:SnoaL-like protein